MILSLAHCGDDELECAPDTGDVTEHDTALVGSGSDNVHELASVTVSAGRSFTAVRSGVELYPANWGGSIQANGLKSSELPYATSDLEMSSGDVAVQRTFVFSTLSDSGEPLIGRHMIYFSLVGPEASDIVIQQKREIVVRPICGAR